MEENNLENKDLNSNQNKNQGQIAGAIVIAGRHAEGVGRAID